MGLKGKVVAANKLLKGKVKSGPKSNVKGKVREKE